MMTNRFRQALFAFGSCTLLFGAVTTVIEPSPASAVSAREAATTLAQSGHIPLVSKVSPASGTSSGNTVVTIVGRNLAQASSVTFGPRGPGAILAESSSQITVIDPPHSPGRVNVIVTLPNGRSSATSTSSHFTYVVAPGEFPSTITGTFSDDFTSGNVPGPYPPAETSTAGTFTLVYDPHSCVAEPTESADAACYVATSVSGTGLQACYPFDDSSPSLVPINFGSDEVDVRARVQVDEAGTYHLFFDFFAPSAADGPVPCDGATQNSVIDLFHDPDGLDTASSDLFTVGQGSASVSAQDNGKDALFGNGITAPGWSGTAHFAFTYGPGPVVVSGGPSGGTVGTTYLDKSIAVSGGTAPYTVTATGLPPGLTITSTGAISGTPSVAGTYTPTIRAVDSSKPAMSGTVTPTMVIAQGTPIVTLSASPTSPQTAGTTLTLTATVTGTAPGTADKGTVSLSSDGQAITCSSTKVAKNKLTCTTTVGALGASGHHSLLASVAQDANYEAATSAPLQYRVK
jgi:hypothetical protein